MFINGAFCLISEKTKKSKGTTVSLQEFNQRLEDSKVAAGQNIVYAPKKPMSSWADEVENDGEKLKF